MDLAELLKYAVQYGASDLHLTVGRPPMVRISGRLIASGYETEITPDESKALVYSILTDDQKARFEEEHELDLSIGIPGVSRFRVNVFMQRGCVAGVFRAIGENIPTVDMLGLSETICQLALLPRGLVVVTGPTGSGKSTTLAAMVDHINKEEYGHILTIEDPIEFVHQSQRCLVNQREVHRDTLGFAEALRSALREDPDIILVGEMRDRETISLALTAAETGHLVFGTLHTSSAPKTIDRIIDVFPAGEKPMVRSMLSESLRAVISQALLKKKGGGRIAAHEIMVGVPAIRNLIREDKVAQMYSSIQTGSAYGMQTLDQCLLELIKKGIVGREEAVSYAQNKNSFKAGV